MDDRVLGLDGSKKRWVGVVLLGGRYHCACLFNSIREALGAEPKAEVVGIDVPIGFAEGHGRPADHEARRFVGDRRNSVFMTFPEAVLAAATYAEAAALARQLTHKAITRQGYALRANILEAATAAKNDARLFEVHPEVSFAALAGAPLTFTKKCWNGLAERRRLLERKGHLEIPDELPEAVGRVAADDILDAAVAAWTARRIAKGRAETLPASMGPTPGRRTGVIWY